MFFVINNSDGDTDVSVYTKDQLIRKLNDDWWGDDVVFLNSIPDNTDTNYWGESILIIEGEIAVPQAVQVATEYKL